MERVQFIGVSELDEGQQIDIRGVVSEFLRKFEKSFAIERINVHVKQYDKGGKPKFSVHIRLVSPKHSKDGAADDYILTKAVHFAFEAIEKQLAHEH